MSGLIARFGYLPGPVAGFAFTIPPQNSPGLLTDRFDNRIVQKGWVICMNKKPIHLGVALLFSVLAVFPVVASEGPAVLDQGGTVFVSFLNTYADVGDPSANRMGWIGWRVADASSVGGGAESEQAVSGEISGELTAVAFGALAEPGLSSLESMVVVLGRIPDEGVETYTPVAFDARTDEPAEPTWLYEWDLDGDGDFEVSGSSPIVSHVYTDNGIYSVRVAIRDHVGGRLVSEPVEVEVANRAPQAAFQLEDESIVERQAVALIDASTDLDGQIVSWQWDFGDGSGSSDAAPMHAYAEQGVYIVKLIAVDDDGRASEPYSMEVTVENAPPVAAFRAEVADATTGAMRFIDESSDPSLYGAIVHAAWDFGDGTYRSGSSADGGVTLHQYDAPGVYDVTLYVIDRDGGMSILTQQILVPSS